MDLPQAARHPQRQATRSHQTGLRHTGRGRTATAGSVPEAYCIRAMREPRALGTGQLPAGVSAITHVHGHLA